MTSTDWDRREREMAPAWGRLAERRPRDTSTYGWAASIALVAVLAVAFLAMGWGIGWWLA